jgi:hypothetical protein
MSVSRKSSLASAVSAWSRQSLAVSASEFMTLHDISRLVVREMVAWKPESIARRVMAKKGMTQVWICIHPYRRPPLHCFQVKWH